MNEAVGFLSVPAPLPSLALSFSLPLPRDTHTNIWQRVWSETGRGSAGAYGQQHQLDEATCVCEGHEIHSPTHWLERWIMYLWGRENLIPTPLTKISSVFAGFSQLETEEVKVLIIYLCVKLLVHVCLIVCVIIKSTSLPTTITPTSTHPGTAGGGKKRWMMAGFHYPPSLMQQILVLSLVSVPLSDHTPSSPPRPFPPQAAQATPWLLWAPSFIFLFCCCNSSGRGSLGVVVCCMLALSSSSPLCWRLGGGGGGVKPAYAPCLQPFCSVNPHCLVILFKLTWMLLFGFGACGSFFFFYISLFCYRFRKHVSLFLTASVISSSQCSQHNHKTVKDNRDPKCCFSERSYA